jgi:hypothetical protein
LYPKLYLHGGRVAAFVGVVAFIDWLWFYKKLPSCAGWQNISQFSGNANCKPHTTEISDFRMQIADLRAHNLTIKNACTSIYNFTLLRKPDGVVESMKSQTPSTKPGPRPEGGDSEGQISGFQVSGVNVEVSGKRNMEAETSFFSAEEILDKITVLY